MASCELIDGKAISEDVLREIEEEVKGMKERGERPPGLGVVLVGERKDSQTYVRMKKRAAGKEGEGGEKGEGIVLEIEGLYFCGDLDGA
jgi:5,10-methylene-tetrahydrofolate dehydrogenase/methenyl tetrahydrofolate cyclohydrolase